MEDGADLDPGDAQVKIFASNSARLATAAWVTISRVEEGIFYKE